MLDKTEDHTSGLDCNSFWPEQIVASKRFDPRAQETREMLDIVFMRFTKSFSITLLFPFLKRYLPESESDRGVKGPYTSGVSCLYIFFYF